MFCLVDPNISLSPLFSNTPNPYKYYHILYLVIPSKTVVQYTYKNFTLIFWYFNFLSKINNVTSQKLWTIRQKSKPHTKYTCKMF